LERESDISLAGEAEVHQEEGVGEEEVFPRGVILVQRLELYFEREVLATARATYFDVCHRLPSLHCCFVSEGL
jgi:hypothetical protein